MKTRFIRTFACTALAGLGLMLGHSAMAQGAGVSASVEPRQFSTDEAARLTVTLSGESVAEPILPNVDGIQFHPAGQSTQMQSINGVVSTSRSYSYHVVAQEAGAYDIPPIQARIDGAVRQSVPMAIRVVQGSGNHRALQLAPPSGSQGRQAETGSLTEEEANSLAFLRIQPSKTTPYLGELVPVQIKAYFRETLQARLDGLPQLQGGAFTLHKLSNEPQRTREVVGNQVYSVLTWYTGISATKQGDYPVAAQLDATLVVPERGRARSRSMSGRSPFDSLFDDDMFASFFGRVQERRVTLASEDESIRVLPLPVDGRPANFSGAVGRFELSATAAPVKLALGDPVTFRTAITGHGNFDRVSHPRLSEDSGFKTYEATAEFTPKDTVGYAGTKTFEQAIIPQDGSLTEIPAITLTYFDPDTAQYETLKTDPISFQISPALGAVAHSTLLSKAAATVAPIPADSASVDIPEAGPSLHVDLGHLSRDLRPTLFRPWFIGLQVLLLIVLGLGVYLHRRNLRLLEDPSHFRRKHTNRAIDGATASMERAIHESDVPAFFDACRRAVQERLGELWGLQPLAITLADIRKRLPEKIELQRAFETADAVTYSGQTYTQDQLRSYQSTLHQELQTLRGKA